MSWMLEAPLAVVFRRRENFGEPVNDRRLRARITAGEILRICAGSYAGASQWEKLKPIARHAQLVWEAGARIQPGAVFSHFAAAALHGIDILGAWPATVDVSIESAGGGRSSGSIQRHARDLETIQTQPWGLHAVTTPLQTALDLAVQLKFVDAVVVADQSLWARRAGGALITQAEFRDAASSYAGRGAARATRVAEFATSLSDSVRESQSRVLIDAMGFPEPELQRRFVLPDGSVIFTDFFWREHSHVGEFDGVGKYRDPEILAGRKGEDVLIAEKDRQDALRRQVSTFSRWRTPALTSPKLLYDILRDAGLPTSLPRPGY